MTDAERIAELEAALRAIQKLCTAPSISRSQILAIVGGVIS